MRGRSAPRAPVEKLAEIEGGKASRKMLAADNSSLMDSKVSFTCKKFLQSTGNSCLHVVVLRHHAVENLCEVFFDF